MPNIFAGLEKFGFKTKDVESLTPLNQPKRASEKKDGAENKKFDINDYIIQRPFECPVCYKSFTSPSLRTGKVRLSQIDYDLRPIYENIEPLLYDAIMCNHCGYAAVSQKFKPLPDKITSIVHEFLVSSFTPIPTVESIDIDGAIDRYKMALLCAAKRGAKDGERAFICLKLTWLYRILGSREDELTFMALAYKGLKNAYSTESMPVCGLTPHTILFLLAAFCKTLGNYDEAQKYLSGLIVDRGAPDNIRERARDLRDELQKRGK